MSTVRLVSTRWHRPVIERLLGRTNSTPLVLDGRWVRREHVLVVHASLTRILNGLWHVVIDVSVSERSWRARLLKEDGTVDNVPVYQADLLGGLFK